MNKKSFWKRTNRGFLVSMVLLAAVLLYVLVTQLMLIPQRSEINQLGDAVNKLWRDSSMLSDEIAAQMKDSPDKQKAETARIEQELAKLFVDKSDYLGTAADYLFNNVQMEFDGTQRTRKREAVETKYEKCNILEDTATVEIRYTYRVDGAFYVYDKGGSGGMDEQEGVRQTMYLGFISKKVNGEWKIYRISNFGVGTETSGVGRWTD